MNLKRFSVDLPERILLAQIVLICVVLLLIVL
jgi:hypothetical protein